MHPTLAQIGSDPLVGSSERFPTGRARCEPLTSDEWPSPWTDRPFGLRFAAAPQLSGRPLPAWRYCPERQIAITPDDSPWYRRVVGMTNRTTGASPDGGGSTGGEEWTPDVVPDEEAPA